MAQGSFQPNRKGIEAFLNSPKVGAMCVAKAEAVKVKAVSLAADFSDSHHYQESFGVRPTKVRLEGSRNSGPRAGAVVFNTAEYASIVEIGDGQTAHHTISRAIEATE